MASTDALPIPRKNVAFRVTFPILDNDGDLVTGAAGLDSEISKDGGTFSDCTNEATEIATSSGMYYLDLTSTEMNADTVAIIVKTSTTDAKTTTIVIYPAEDAELRASVRDFGGTAGTFASGRPEVNTTHISGSSTAADNAEIVFDTDFATNYDMTLDSWMVNVYSFSTGAISAGAFGTGAISADALGSDAVEEIRDSVVAIFTDDVGTAQAGAAGTITLRSGAVATDDYYNGAYVTLTGGTGVGQTRKITDYVGSTKVATLDSNWVTNPDNTSTYIILGRAV